MNTTKKSVLDLFCNAGGAGTGYCLAGFDVVGVDVVDQPNNYFPMHISDALAFVRENRGHIRHTFDLVHASPPCQFDAAITRGTNRHLRKKYADLYDRTRQALEELGLPYVIETPRARPDVVLCGEMFGLGVIRHRRFELGGWGTDRPAHIPHRGRVRGWRHGVYFDGPYVAAYGKGGGKATVPEMQEAMGIRWTGVHAELVEMIPPAYTEWIGRRFLASNGGKAEQ